MIIRDPIAMSGSRAAGQAGNDDGTEAGENPPTAINNHKKNTKTA